MNARARECAKRCWDGIEWSYYVCVCVCTYVAPQYYCDNRCHATRARCVCAVRIAIDSSHIFIMHVRNWFLGCRCQAAEATATARREYIVAPHYCPSHSRISNEWTYEYNDNSACLLFTVDACVIATEYTLHARVCVCVEAPFATA